MCGRLRVGKDFLHVAQARCQLLEERQNLAAPQLSPDYYFAVRVHPVNLENQLGDIETDRRDRLRLWLLRIVVTFNSNHILGTHVPVEGPSTASEAGM